MTSAESKSTPRPQLSTVQSVFSYGVSFKDTPISLREKLSLTAATIERVLPAIMLRFPLEELIILSTCNRVDLIGISREQSLFDQGLSQLFVAIQEIASDGVSQLSSREIEEHAHQYRGADAVTYVMRVAASLESLIIGETQITGQFKDALAISQSQGTCGRILIRLGQNALALAKRVRNETPIGNKPTSISHAAVQMVETIFSDLTDKTCLILGTGHMGGLAARYLQKRKPKALLLVNRTRARAETLAQEIGGGDVYEADELARLLDDADVIISASGAQQRLITLEMVKRAQKRRRSPQVFVDIGMPRDIDAQIADLDNVYHIDIDDLVNVTQDNQAERQSAAQAGHELAVKATVEFTAWLEKAELTPKLADLRTYLEQLIEQEFLRTFGREMFTSMSPKQIQAIQQLKQALAARIMTDTSRRLLAGEEHISRELLAGMIDLSTLAALTRTPQ